jgi:ribonuclease BN (tRNA processing enzyme)
MGVMSFAPLYDRRWAVEFVAPLREEVTPEQAITILFGKPFWPVRLRTLPSRIRFTTLPDQHSKQPLTCAGLTVRWGPVHHSEGCTAYRIEEPSSGRAFVFATDVEWGASSQLEKEVFLDLCGRPEPVDLLVMDGQFTRANYESHRGWGHSTIEEIAEISGRLEIENTLITHHSPESDDRRLEELEKDLEILGGTVHLARQGLEVVL